MMPLVIIEIHRIFDSSKTNLGFFPGTTWQEQPRRHELPWLYQSRNQAIRRPEPMP